MLRWTLALGSLGAMASILLACDSRSDLALAPNSSSLSRSAGIIGGQSLNEEDLVARVTVALINTTTSKVCSGVVISTDAIITARRCLNGANADSILIKFGSSVVNYASRRSRHWVTPQPEINSYNDIGLVFFNGGLPEGYTFALVLENFNMAQAGTPILLAGFGIQSLKDQTPVVLRRVSHRIATVQDGKKLFAIDQRNNSGLCHGDTGGPAFIYVGNRPYLFGIASEHDDNCAQWGSIVNLGAYYENFLRPNMSRHSGYRRIGQYGL